MAALPLQLKELTISGYRGVSNAVGKELRVCDLASRNIFIGQNNGGKSTVYRFLLLASKHLAGQGNHFPYATSVTFDPNLFWQQHEDVAPSAVLTFNSPGPDYARVEQLGAGGAIVRENKWRLSIHILPVGGRQASFFACPQAWVESKTMWLDVVGRSGVQRSEMTYLSGDGQYLKQGGREKPPYAEGANSLAPLVKVWAESGHFFDPFRSLHRSGHNEERVEDGSGVLRRLYDWQNDHNRAATYHRFRNKLRDRLNRLFDHRYAEIVLRATPTLDMSLTLDVPDAIPIPLQSMGSGISQMVIILASLEADKLEGLKGTHYHLEEPELHLHPRLLRRFMAQLADYPDAQFFITSHSNVILDALEEHDRVYLFSQESTGNCVARAVEGVVKQHAVLDALGVSGSTLLQTNCVIWVEGPSDRLYLRRWINEVAEQQQRELLEGADYAFVFYGGKVLSHFGFEEDEEGLRDLIPMLTISRYSAVVMDRDRPPTTPEVALSVAKMKIRDEAEKDPAHRLACVTQDREVENDLPLTTFKRGVAAKLGVEAGRLEGLTLTGRDRYPDEIVAHLGLKDKAAEACKRKLEDKVGLAKSVLVALEGQGLKLGSPPPYVTQLVEFIVRSKVA